ncbi:MAG: HD domain-containing protein, partial [Nitrospira sp.]|nr:HD domain-containing protein [Nitrospira sp.]
NVKTGKIEGIDPREHSMVLQTAEERRVDLFADLGVDESHQLLFRFFSRIGNAKLSRRYVQLRNFFYLDLLLQQIANGARLSEAQVRCLRPEEIEMCLSRKSWVPPGNLSDRTKYSVLTLTESSEDLFSGFDFKWVESKLDNAIRTPHTRNQKLTGNPLCPGVAKGRVRIINRREQALSSGFQKGDIIVSHSADPELSDLMAEAGGVLVETGGVTCHAAIICRELGKPAISNISNLRAELSDGDFVEMDSYIGEVQIKRMRPMRYAKHSRNITPEDRLQVGTKATTLAILESLGFSIPGFFVVPLKSDALSASPDDASGTEKNLFIQEIQDAVDLVGGKMFILRSSLVDEDIIGVSTAGQYVSESNVDHEDIMATLLRLIDRYSKALSENEGSIIVQEMILSDYSGVCFTSNPLTGSGDQMIIELVPGGNDLLTGGVIAPKTLHFSKSTGTLEDVTGSNSWGRFFDSQIILDLAECCRKIEEHFGRPQDIEWAVKGSRLWIVQSRDIQTSDSSVLPARKFDAHARGGLRDIATICRAYRVPPNLKLHLLRVAAFASKICQNWAGAKIDQQLIIKALLLHDIGNIVKADYRRNPGLFPEEMQNLKYWMAVQDMIKEKYGDDDMGATLAIAQDIGVSDNVIKLITEKQFILNDETLQSDDWNRKIAAYSDQRIGPWGVLSLRERLSEAKRRYKNVEGASVNIRGFEGLVRSAEKIEAQLTENLKFNILTIDDKMLEPIIEDLRSMRIF